jgi:hypothetical protein
MVNQITIEAPSLKVQSTLSALLSAGNRQRDRKPPAEITDVPQLREGTRPKSASIIIFGAHLEGVIASSAVSLKMRSSSMAVFAIGEQPEQVLLQMAGGSGLLVPVVPGYTAYLRFNSKSLLQSLTYESSLESSATRRGHSASDAIISLRDFLSKLAASGDLYLARVDGEKLAHALQMIENDDTVDFGLLVLLSYVAHTSRNKGMLMQLATFAERRLGFLPLDLAVFFSLNIHGFQVGRHRILPYAPFLSQDWQFLKIARFAVPFNLSELRVRLRRSVWTVFDRAGSDMAGVYVQTYTATDFLTGNSQSRTERAEARYE